MYISVILLIIHIALLEDIVAKAEWELCQKSFFPPIKFFFSFFLSFFFSLFLFYSLYLFVCGFRFTFRFHFSHSIHFLFLSHFFVNDRSLKTEFPPLVKTAAWHRITKQKPGGNRSTLAQNRLKLEHQISYFRRSAE